MSKIKGDAERNGAAAGKLQPNSKKPIRRDFREGLAQHNLVEFRKKLFEVLKMVPKVKKRKFGDVVMGMLICCDGSAVQKMRQGKQKFQWRDFVSLLVAAKQWCKIHSLAVNPPIELSHFEVDSSQDAIVSALRFSVTRRRLNRKDEYKVTSSDVFSDEHFKVLSNCGKFGQPDTVGNDGRLLATLRAYRELLSDKTDNEREVLKGYRASGDLIDLAVKNRDQILHDSDDEFESLCQWGLEYAEVLGCCWLSPLVQNAWKKNSEPK